MLKLTPTPALKAGQFDGNGLNISENTSVALASIAARLGQEGKCATAAKKLFGTELPAPQELVSGGDFTVFWTAPDQFFVEAPIETHEDIETLLKTALKDTASVTDQSGGWVRLDVTGPKIVTTFERLCMVDLATMSENRAVRTVIEHIGCFIVTRADGLSVCAAVLCRIALSRHGGRGKKRLSYNNADGSISTGSSSACLNFET